MLMLCDVICPHTGMHGLTVEHEGTIVSDTERMRKQCLHQCNNEEDAHTKSVRTHRFVVCCSKKGMGV